MAKEDFFPRGTMDVGATEAAIAMLEYRASERVFAASEKNNYAPRLMPVPSTVGVAIAASAAYRLRTQLRDYLTRGK